MNNDFDIAIVGSGLVGLATACAVKQSGLKIAIIDSKLNFEKLTHQFDNIGIRASAINGASQRYFAEMGIWTDLYESRRIQEFNQIEVTEKDGQAYLSANANDYNYPNLGCIIENHVMQYFLFQKILTSPTITFINQSVIHSHFFDNHAVLTLDDNSYLTTKLVIGADGAHSWLRANEDISLFEKEYKHHALITTVSSEIPHQAIARQIFYANGIVAFLPLWHANKSCLVWSTKPEIAKNLTELSNEQFSAELFALSGDKMGQCELINDRMVFPLKARFASQFIKHRLVLIGDAAHTIHPLAGQGANLGLQDSAMLVATIKQNRQSGKDIGLASNLRQFQLKRRKDTLVMLAAMQTIQDMFDGENSVKKFVRTKGMNFINHCAPIKKQLIKYAMHI